MCLRHGLWGMIVRWSFSVLHSFSLSPSVKRFAMTASSVQQRLLGQRPVVMLGACLSLALSSGYAQATTTQTHHVKHRATSKTASSSSKGNPVILTQQLGTELDKAARKLAADDIATSRRHKEEPLVLIGSAPLSTKKGDVALLIELQSAALCGSAGCSTDVYLHKDQDWVKILDSVSGQIAVLPTSHRGMYDLMVDGSDRWLWDGNTYQDTINAAPIGNLRGEIEQFQNKHKKTKN
ncbi:hypothetical protein [Acetobacter aceti]|nr:hypothetical protein [Acetobacter aceti]